MDDLFSDAVRQVLAAQVCPAVVRQIEAGGTPAGLWQHIEAAGFADALVPEAQGGAALSLAEVYPVLELCGEYAVPVPLAETLLARAVLASAGVRARFQGMLDQMAASATGSANRIARLCLLAEPPTIDRSEITDKGSINQRAVLAHRAAIVEALHADTLPGTLKPAAR